MTAQTLNDVLSRTREFHDQLAKSLDSAADSTTSERAELLLEYLSDHEQQLSETVKAAQDSADENDLDTWFYEFTQKHNVIHAEPDHKPFDAMDTEEIMAEVMNQHEQIIQLYRYLYGRAWASSAKPLLQQLIDLEKHQAMLLAREGMRAEDM